MDIVPDSHQDLLADAAKAFAFLATIMSDGTPQVTPVWFNTHCEHILVNSALGRVKDRNMRARPDVALTILVLDKPYRYLQIRGRVVEITTEGGDAHIHALSCKYRGEDYTIPAGQVRTIYKILPESANTMG